MKKIFIILNVFSFFSVFSYAQKKYTDIVPPSPNAAAIAKFGDIPVSLFTGTPSVSVQFFEIGIKDIKVSVGISYHAGGVKVGEDASNIGIGWALNAGGAITRTVRGLADEETSYGYFIHNTDLSVIPSTENARQELYNKIRAEELDTEPDSYNFNFLGRSGRFIAKKVSSTSIEGYTIDGSNLKIQWMLLPPSNNKFQWIITDESGTRYYFGQASVGDDTQKSYETSTTRSITYSTSRGGRDEGKVNNAQRIYPSAWYLKQIVLNNGEQINFYYNDYITNTCGLSNEYNVYGYGNADACSNLTINRATINKTEVSGKKISAIVTNNARIDFTYSTQIRQDLIINSGNNTPDNYLDKVSLSTLSGEVIKYFTLSHSYFNLTSINNQFAVDCPQPAKGKLRLDAVQEFGKNGAAINPYVFTYEGTSLPHTLSYAQDHWGFYNGQSNTTLIPEYTVTLSSYNNMDILPGAKRFSSFSHAKLGTLTIVKYPTGGQTFFNYESHKAWTQDFGFETSTEGSCTDAITLSQSDLVPPSNVANKDLIVNGTQCYKGQTGQWYKFNANTPTPCNWNERGEGGCGTNLSLLGITPSISLNGLQNFKKFLPNGSYTLRLQLLDPDYAPTDLTLTVCKISQESNVNGFTDGYSMKDLNTQCSPTSQDYNKSIGGLRIASMVNKDGNNVVSVTKYFYKKLNDNTQSSGKLVKIPVYDNTEDHNGEVICFKFIRSSFSQIPVYASSGNHVEYTYVEEVKTNSEAAEITDGLKTAYSYYTLSLANPPYPFPEPNSYETRRGKLLKQADFLLKNENGVNVYKIVKSDTLIYEFGDTRYKPVNIGLKAGCLITNGLINLPACLSPIFVQTTKEVDWTYVKEKKEKVYDPADKTKFVVSRDSYVYDNISFRQLSTMKRIDGKSKLTNAATDTYDREIITNYKYTFDSAEPPFAEMQSRNILDVVEEKVELKENSTTKLLSKSKTTFKKWFSENNYGGLSGFFAPSKIESWLSAEDDDHKNKEIRFEDYNHLGNLTEYIENNNKKVFMTYYDDAGKKNLLKTQTIGTGTTVEQTTTYDYFPLIGTRVVEQPSGLKTFYEYDDLSRLKFIKDNDGKLVKSYQYNYAKQSAGSSVPTPTFTGQIDISNREINLSFSYPTTEVVKYEIRRGKGSEPLKLWVTIPGNNTTKIDPSYTPQQNIYNYEIRAVLSNGTATDWKPLNITLPASCTNNLQLIKNGLISAGQVKIDKACYEIIFEEGFITEDNADYTAEIETP